MQHSDHARMEEPPRSEGTGNRLLYAFRHAGQHVCGRDGWQGGKESGGRLKPGQCSPSDRLDRSECATLSQHLQENEAAAAELVLPKGSARLRCVEAPTIHVPTAVSEMCIDDEDRFGHGGALEADEENCASTQRPRE